MRFNVMLIVDRRQLLRRFCQVWERYVVEFNVLATIMCVSYLYMFIYIYIYVETKGKVQQSRVQEDG